VITGRVHERQRAALIQRALLAVQPSLYEGFGLGVLEALAQRIPTVCSDIPSHREVAGEGALFFDPLDAGQLARRLAQGAFDSSLRRRLQTRGLQSANRFSWDQSAFALAELWKQVAGREFVA
jgi:alpha-1,3-rhamnosyl/mannosyltransferase